jgi:hypothetical protein
MIFKEYRIASERHEQACEILLKNLRQYSQEKQQRILHQVYYLAGYIYECIYKYAIFARLSEWNPEDPVDVLNQDGLSFKKDINSHKFSHFKDILSTKMTTPIPFINYEDGIDEEILEMYEDWRTKFRYEGYSKYGEEKIREFVEWGKKTRREVLNNV